MTVSKSLRFEIFRRDAFTCQYCGRRPPNSVLEVDHILPICEGGDDDPSNLVTSCYDCNHGKGRKQLKPNAAPHDTDQDYLEAEQRLAELERYRQVQKQLNEALEGTVSDLQEFFAKQLATSRVPEGTSIRWQLYYHDPEEIEKAVLLTQNRLAPNADPLEKWRYACAILRNWRKGESYAT